MVVNVCKHNERFQLCYCAKAETYVWRCERCQVFKMNFDPVGAGKIRGSYFPRDPEGTLLADWHVETIAYVKKPPAAKDRSNRPFPILIRNGAVLG